MLRSRPSFHKSMPNIAQHHNSRASSASRIPSSTSSSKTIIGRDELEERYLDLRDRHLGLRKEATAAQEELRLLHVKLNRLLDEKKRYFRHRRTEREVVLEETILDLEQQLGRQAMANDRLRDRMQLMRVTKSDEIEVKGHRSSQALVKRPYSHVQSRVDSGLGPQPPPPVFSFRPSSTSHLSKSSLELHPRSSSPTKSGILKNSGEFSNKLPLSATLLMREAKEEIIRLEEIIAEQQMMLDTLLSADPEDQVGETSENNLPTSNSNSFSYQLTTTTTATASLTSASGASQQTMSNGYHQNHHLNPHNLDLQELQNGSSSPAVIDLYTKYQQLIMRQESAQKLSTDVRTLIESLYRSLRKEKAKVSELRRKLAAKDELNLVISEKDTQIEALRKENALLQQSLADCIAQCMVFTYSEGQSSKDEGERSMVVPANLSTASAKYLENLKSVLTTRSDAAQQEAEELGKKLAETEVQLASERSRYGQLQAKYSTLEQLSESDALHVNHLEAKIARLTALIFPMVETEIEIKNSTKTLQKGRARSAAVVKENQQPEKISEIENEKMEVQQRSSTKEVEIENIDKNFNSVEKDNFDNDGKDEDKKEDELQTLMNENGNVTEELDQLLNSLPPVPATPFEQRRPSKD